MPFRLCLPFWYLLLIGFVLSCCSLQLYPDWNPFARQGFPLTESPPASIDAGSLSHRLCRHRYYWFFRLLITHWSAFPIQVMARLPCIPSTESSDPETCRVWFSFREDVMRPPSVAQESILNHPCHDHPIAHYSAQVSACVGSVTSR